MKKREKSKIPLLKNSKEAPKSNTSDSNTSPNPSIRHSTTSENKHKKRVSATKKQKMEQRENSNRTKSSIQKPKDSSSSSVTKEIELDMKNSGKKDEKEHIEDKLSKEDINKEKKQIEDKEEEESLTTSKILKRESSSRKSSASSTKRRSSVTFIPEDKLKEQFEKEEKTIKTIKKPNSKMDSSIKTSEKPQHIAPTSSKLSSKHASEIEVSESATTTVEGFTSDSDSKRGSKIFVKPVKKILRKNSFTTSDSSLNTKVMKEKPQTKLTKKEPRSQIGENFPKPLASTSETPKVKPPVKRTKSETALKVTKAEPKTKTITKDESPKDEAQQKTTKGEISQKTTKNDLRKKSESGRSRKDSLSTIETPLEDRKRSASKKITLENSKKIDEKIKKSEENPSLNIDKSAVETVPPINLQKKVNKKSSVSGSEDNTQLENTSEAAKLSTHVKKSSQVSSETNMSGKERLQKSIKKEKRIREMKVEVQEMLNKKMGKGLKLEFIQNLLDSISSEDLESTISSEVPTSFLKALKAKSSQQESKNDSISDNTSQDAEYEFQYSEKLSKGDADKLSSGRNSISSKKITNRDNDYETGDEGELEELDEDDELLSNAGNNMIKNVEVSNKQEDVVQLQESQRGEREYSDEESSEDEVQFLSEKSVEEDASSDHEESMEFENNMSDENESLSLPKGKSFNDYKKDEKSMSVDKYFEENKNKSDDISFSNTVEERKNKGGSIGKKSSSMRNKKLALKMEKVTPSSSEEKNSHFSEQRSREKSERKLCEEILEGVEMSASIENLENSQTLESVKEHQTSDGLEEDSQSLEDIEEDGQPLEDTEGDDQSLEDNEDVQTLEDSEEDSQSLEDTEEKSKLLEDLEIENKSIEDFEEELKSVDDVEEVSQSTEDSEDEIQSTDDLEENPLQEDLKDKPIEHLVEKSELVCELEEKIELTDDLDEKNLPTHDSDEESKPLDDLEKGSQKSDDLEEESQSIDDIEDDSGPIDNLEDESNSLEDLEEESSQIDELEEEGAIPEHFEEEKPQTDDLEEEGAISEDFEEERPQTDDLEEEESPAQDLTEERFQLEDLNEESPNLKNFEENSDVVDEETLNEKKQNLHQPEEEDYSDETGGLELEDAPSEIEVEAIDVKVKAEKIEEAEENQNKEKTHKIESGNEISNGQVELSKVEENVLHTDDGANSDRELKAFELKENMPKKSSEEKTLKDEKEESRELKEHEKIEEMGDEEKKVLKIGLEAKVALESLTDDSKQFQIEAPQFSLEKSAPFEVQITAEGPDNLLEGSVELGEGREETPQETESFKTKTETEPKNISEDVERSPEHKKRELMQDEISENDVSEAVVETFEVSEKSLQKVQKDLEDPVAEDVKIIDEKTITDNIDQTELLTEEKSGNKKSEENETENTKDKEKDDDFTQDKSIFGEESQSEKMQKENQVINIEENQNGFFQKIKCEETPQPSDENDPLETGVIKTDPLDRTEKILVESDKAKIDNVTIDCSLEKVEKDELNVAPSGHDYDINVVAENTKNASGYDNKSEFNTQSKENQTIVEEVFKEQENIQNHVMDEGKKDVAAEVKVMSEAPSSDKEKDQLSRQQSHEGLDAGGEDSHLKKESDPTIFSNISRNIFKKRSSLPTSFLDQEITILPDALSSEDKEGPKIYRSDQEEVDSSSVTPKVVVESFTLVDDGKVLANNENQYEVSVSSTEGKANLSEVDDVKREMRLEREATELKADSREGEKSTDHKDEKISSSNETKLALEKILTLMEQLAHQNSVSKLGQNEGIQGSAILNAKIKDQAMKPLSELEAKNGADSDKIIQSHKKDNLSEKDAELKEEEKVDTMANEKVDEMDVTPYKETIQKSNTPIDSLISEDYDEKINLFPLTSEDSLVLENDVRKEPLSPSEQYLLSEERELNDAKESRNIAKEVEFALENIIEMKSTMSKMMALLEKTSASKKNINGDDDSVRSLISQISLYSDMVQDIMPVIDEKDGDSTIYNGQISDRTQSVSEGKISASFPSPPPSAILYDDPPPAIEEINVSPIMSVKQEGQPKSSVDAERVNLISRVNEKREFFNNLSKANETIQTHHQICLQDSIQAKKTAKSTGVSEDSLLPVCEQRRVFEMEAMKAMFDEVSLQKSSGGKVSDSEFAPSVLDQNNLGESLVQNSFISNDSYSKRATKSAEDLSRCGICHEDKLSNLATITCSLCKNQQTTNTSSSLRNISTSVVKIIKVQDGGSQTFEDEFKSNKLEYSDKCFRDERQSTPNPSKNDNMEEHSTNESDRAAMNETFLELSLHETNEDLIEKFKVNCLLPQKDFDPAHSLTEKEDEEQSLSSTSIEFCGIGEAVAAEFEENFILDSQYKDSRDKEDTIRKDNERPFVETTEKAVSPFSPSHFDDSVAYKIMNSASNLSRSFSESNLRNKLFKFSVSMDDLDQTDSLTISFVGDNINISSTSQLLAKSNIDISSSESGTYLTLRPIAKRYSSSSSHLQDEKPLLEDLQECADSVEEELNGKDVLAEEDKDTTTETIIEKKQSPVEILKDRYEYELPPSRLYFFDEDTLNSKPEEEPIDRPSSPYIFGTKPEKGRPPSQSSTTSSEKVTIDQQSPSEIDDLAADSMRKDQMADHEKASNETLNSLLENVGINGQDFPLEDEDRNEEIERDYSDDNEDDEHDKFDEDGYKVGRYTRINRRPMISRPKKFLRFSPQVDSGSKEDSTCPKNSKLYKILFIGSSSAGKTSIIRRYVKHTFSSSYRTTIGADFLSKVVQWDEEVTLRLQLWDIAGQDRFSLLSRSFYKDAVGAFIVCDITRPETLDACVPWKEELDAKVQNADGGKIPCFLLANKCDLVEDSTGQSKLHSKVCQQHGFHGWMQTSAKENINITQAIEMLLRQIIKEDFDSTPTVTDQESLILEKDAKKKKRVGCLC